jgi:serine/threonine protein kinase
LAGTVFHFIVNHHLDLVGIAAKILQTDGARRRRSAVGTPQYMAPEVINGRLLTTLSLILIDQYAISGNLL